ncbi:NAF1-domain-containing protein, partial [Rhizodiscina lignyota]
MEYQDGEHNAAQLRQAEFLEAAKQNRGSQNAEWQFDSSDAESSDDSSDSSDDSDEEDEKEDGEEHDAEDEEMLGTGSRGPIHSANEVVDMQYQKPDITVTPEMAITELGTIDNILGNLVLIHANVSGEYRVLESDSLLCLADRTVIGVVSETLGRVQKPIYTVGFQRESEITEASLTKGTKIFYVDAHSTFVFTQPLQHSKGTDASNIHDEEVYGEEIEFSDDEK